MNNFKKDFPSEIKPDMEEYYNMREKVRELYSVGAAVNPKVNDLCSTVLQIRDKNRCVESINVDTVNYIIEVDLEEGTSTDTCLKIRDEIASTIDKYIANNIDSIKTIEKEDYEKVQNTKLHDDLVIGNYIRFNL